MKTQIYCSKRCGDIARDAIRYAENCAEMKRRSREYTRNNLHKIRELRRHRAAERALALLILPMQTPPET